MAGVIWFATSARAEYPRDSCTGFWRYGGLVLWMKLSLAWCLVYPIAATVWIKRRVARHLASAALETQQSESRPRTGVLTWTLAFAFFSFVYWFATVFLCTFHAHITPLGALLPYLTAAVLSMRILVWRASRRLVNWHHAKRADG